MRRASRPGTGCHQSMRRWPRKTGLAGPRACRQRDADENGDAEFGVLAGLGLDRPPVEGPDGDLDRQGALSTPATKSTISPVGEPGRDALPGGAAGGRRWRFRGRKVHVMAHVEAPDAGQDLVGVGGRDDHLQGIFTARDAILTGRRDICSDDGGNPIQERFGVASTPERVMTEVAETVCRDLAGIEFVSELERRARVFPGALVSRTGY